MAQSGITYFMLDTNIYRGDYTKKCSLTGGEIDRNFNFLRGMDIVDGFYDDNGILHLINLGGDDIPITSGATNIFGEGIDFSGTSYDKETGILNISVNGETIHITGLTTCDCEDIGCRLSNVEGGLSGLSEDFEAFKNSMGELTTGGTLDVNKLFTSVAFISGATVNNSSSIKNLEAKTQSLDASVKGLDNDVETISGHTEDLAANIHALSAKTMAIENQVENIQGETLNKVEERLKKQDDKIDAIGKNVDNVLDNTKSALDLSKAALANSESALAEIQRHEITDVVLNGDQLALHYREPDHNSIGISLAKYNYTADEETIHKEGTKFSAVVNKEKGLVSWEKFNEHVAKYNDLLSKYNALAKEFDDYKNADKYYMGVVGENEIDVEQDINIDIILQHKFIVDYNPNSKECMYICSEGNYFMVAVPKGTDFNVKDDFNLPIKTALISTLKNYQDKLYDIYITEKMSFKSGSRYILSIL